MVPAESEVSIPTVREFYENAVVFITGGTGFVGKVLVEKLLRTYQVKSIYLLIREKDNMNAEERLEKYLTESIFDDIRKHSPEKFNKVFPISADFSAIELGISKTDRALLNDEVQIVFNVVASVKFNEKLSDAIAINVLGTKKILDLAMEMKRLKAFLHISTLYSNCNRKTIGETIYEPEIGYEKIIQLYKILDADELEKLCHCLVGELPNTYTMTKRCSENLVNQQAYAIPAGIFRPPIVLSTYKEPFPGWTDNLYGPSGICASVARGFVHSIYGNGHKKANLVPVDFCVNAMIASAWDVSIRRTNQKEGTDIPVYNYIFDTNNLTWGSYMHLSRQGFHEPFDKALWCFSYVIVPYKWLHRLTAFLLHEVPGYLLDLMAMASGRKRIYSQGYKKMAKILEMMSYFGLREWSFSNKNIAELDAKLNNKDRSDLEFNLTKVDWREYFSTYMSGIRKYFFKDHEERLAKRKRFYRSLWLFHTMLKTLFGTLGVVFISKIVFRLLSLTRLGRITL
ncbi:unnamed protein product [Hermetia illucens]|uniref:Fatty acyl-CoA reductase n=1 Tax=Hermetia illucens TaxID=343691 RepID=A0A7R8UMK3_HERIL|nr:fatty acyl-CoA reductase wat [Hermetia illucens]CAD7083468.1 unnamed protein product [Hermetia illucens]